ncbi:SDR family oxidoreductase [Falsiroseomonas oryziterrae]|uniref:SDR family oxidoreductase n=1 Tax=Falsiroseomonas oryziterrae TaxID=2911368 RepID=UPI001F182C43|nr:SDR family oxidoreductase [Roseomonas sp. NPKOSM-4]
MDLGIAGKRALVMGASKGLGRSIADALAAEGVALVVSGRDQASLDQVAAELKALGAPAAFGVPADIASAADVDRLADEAVRLLGGVDILVLNHGGPPPCGPLEVTQEQLVEWFPRIVQHPIRIATKLIPGMRSRKYGRVLTVGSTGMEQPIPNLALSNILRGAMVGWNKSVALEVAGDNVTCNILAPGAIMTGRLRETQAGAAKVRGVEVDQVIAERAKTIPAQRIGKPEEFGPLAAFLCSDKGAYITGNILRIDGGMVRSI